MSVKDLLLISNIAFQSHSKNPSPWSHLWIAIFFRGNVKSRLMFPEALDSSWPVSHGRSLPVFRVEDLNGSSICCVYGHYRSCFHQHLWVLSDQSKPLSGFTRTFLAQNNYHVTLSFTSSLVMITYSEEKKYWNILWFCKFSNLKIMEGLI